MGRGGVRVILERYGHSELVCCDNQLRRRRPSAAHCADAAAVATAVAAPVEQLRPLLQLGEPSK